MKKADFPYAKESSALFYWSRGRNESKLATFFVKKVQKFHILFIMYVPKYLKSNLYLIFLTDIKY